MTVKPGATAVADIAEFFGLRTDTPPSKTPANYSPDCADMVFSAGGMGTRNPFRKFAALSAEIVYRKEFQAKNGTTQVLALDARGNLYVVHDDGSYTVLDTVTPGCRVNSITAYGREYMAFFNDAGGCDDPRQWDGQKLSRVSQGGPGAAPTFGPAAPSGDLYGITSITQPAAKTWGSSYFLQSAGVGNNTDAGTNVTVYYADHTAGATADADLEDAFNSGQPTYVRVSFTGTPQTLGPWNALVTSVGFAQPPSQPHSFYYFTFTLPTTALLFYPGSGNPGFTAEYQRTLATLTTAVNVPELAVGDTVAVFGSSLAGYDGYQTITQAQSSASLIITQTALAAGVATYHYIIQTGSYPPGAGQLVTIADTLNANGALNGTNLSIASASGGTSGTFTIAGFTAPDAAVVAESGTAITAGVVFNFDPAVDLVGSVENPIVGNSAGGTLTFSGTTATTVAPGNRQGVAFFITDDENFTSLSIIAKFAIPANTNAIAFSNLPIGPANVKARGLAFTGANGGQFFFLPTAPVINGKVLGTSTRIDDNTTTAGTVFFTDQALLSGIAIDVPGNNMFLQVPLNLPRGVDWYADRMLWLGEKNTVLGLQNMGMDGGTLPGSTAPLGWTAVSAGEVQQDGFMPVYVVTGPGTGEINQGAYQTAAGVAILQPKQRYSVRIWVKGGALFGGTLTAYLSSASTAYHSTATLNASAITTSGYYTFDFFDPTPDVIPADLLFGIKFTEMGGTASIRGMELIYADNPNRNPVARLSYTQNPSAYDAITGNAGPNDDPTELRATAVLQESLHFITERGLYSVQQIGNAEPSSWDVQQIAQNCGAFNANSVVTGKGWIAWAGPEGVFWFAGGIPQKISSIIAPTWRKTVGITNLHNDSDLERVYLGTVDAAGTKSALVYDYHEIAAGGVGKWCPWKRPFGWFSASAAGMVFAIGTKFFHLDTLPGEADDDLGPIGGYYTFAPVASSLTRKLFFFMGLEISGSGILTPFVSAQKPGVVTQTLAPANLAELSDVVAEWDVDVSGRMAYLKIGQPGAAYQLANFAMAYQNDPNQPTSGVR